MIRPGNRNGLLLIVLVGLLTLLTVLSVLFVAMVRTDRFASFTQIDDIRARLLTRAGIEYAVARLRADPDPRQGFLDDPAEDWTYRETEEVPLHSTMNPSYHHGEPWTDLSPNGKYDDGIDVWTEDLNGNGVYDGWSGRLRGSYQSYGDTFKLRIEGQEGKIHLNGGFLDTLDRDDVDGDGVPDGDGIPDHRDVWVDRWIDGYNQGSGIEERVLNAGIGWNGQLARILDNLVEGLLPAVGLARDAATNPRKPQNHPLLIPGRNDFPRSERTLGTALISMRPHGGYRNWGQVDLAITRGISQLGTKEKTLLRSLLPPGGSWSDLLKPYVSLNSWGEEVIRPYVPVVFGSNTNAQWFSPSQIRKWLGPPSMEERAPIQINDAPVPVLVAALTDLNTYQRWDGRIPPSIAQKIADRIQDLREGNEDENGNGKLDPGEDRNGNGFLDAPFRSWRQWNDFCNALAEEAVLFPNAPLRWFPYEGTPAYSSPMTFALRRDVLKTHFNPNGSVLRHAADRNAGYFTFWSGTGPWWEAPMLSKDAVFPYSTEWTFHPSGGFSIESFGAVLAPDHSVRSHRTSWTDLRLFGVHRESTQADFMAGRTAREASFVPFGIPVATSGAAMGIGGEGTGLAVATYPQPMHLLPAAEAEQTDGYVALATLEEMEGGGAVFLHHFDDGWNADTGGNRDAVPPDGVSLVPPATNLWDLENGPGMFYPDGAEIAARNDPIRNPFSALFPRFPVDGNFPTGGRRGFVSVWIKDQFGGNVLSAVGWEENRTQAWILGVEFRSGYRERAGFLVENRLTASGSDRDPDHAGHSAERLAKTDRPRINGHWELLAGHWNLGETGEADTAFWRGGGV